MHGEQCGLRVAELCELFGYTKQAYYQGVQRHYKCEADDFVVLQAVRTIRAELPGVGGRKLQHMLSSDYGIAVGRDALFDMLRRQGMLCKVRRRRVRTTFSGHGLAVYPNLTAGRIPLRPNEIWVSDITYNDIGRSFRYLFLITDAYSKKIVGWRPSDNMGSDNAVVALKMALKQRKDRLPLIHHSDRGLQYCAAKYVTLLRRNGISPSMTEKGDPRENAVAERVNGILKEEFLKYESVNGRNVDGIIACIIRSYNELRPHLSLGYTTPEEAHKMTGPQPRLWKNYYHYEKGNKECVTLQRQTT